MADRPHRPVTSVMMGNHPTLPDESQRNIPIDPRGRDIQRQMYLVQMLRRMGDTRYGGVLPLKGKPYANTVPEWFRRPGLRPMPEERGYPMRVLVDEAADVASYDHQMNMYESELEDLKRRK